MSAAVPAAEEAAPEPVTLRAARRCLEALPGRIDEEALHQARRCLIDSLAVALAAAQERPIALLKDVVLPSSRREASILGTGERASVETAALVNGMMISLLLFDDNHMPMRGHPSAPVLPAALALGEAQDRSVHDALVAFAIDYEVECRLGTVLNPSQYEIGWHATATQGVMGASVAAAILLGLDPGQTAVALGIAGSLAGGLRANFGSMTMSLHSGEAAAGGVRAALLAERGFTAGGDIFGGPLSYGHALSREWDEAVFGASLEQWGEPPMIIEPGPVLKLFPCGRPTLPAVDCVMEIQEKHRLAVDEIEEIRCAVSYMYPRTLIHARPVTGLQGKTSLEYCVAAAFLDNGPKLSSFTDEAVRRPEAASLIERIRVEVPPELSEAVPEVRRAPFDQPVTLTVRTRSGGIHVARVRDHRGMPGNPATDYDLRRKFIGCTEGRLAPTAVDEILAYAHDKNATVRGLLSRIHG
jgi:2-methylcitrate dehydratase PrpD